MHLYFQFVNQIVLKAYLQSIAVLSRNSLDVVRLQRVGQGSSRGLVRVPPFGQVDGCAHVHGYHLKRFLVLVTLGQGETDYNN